jgi:hypothetical protein
VKSVLTPIGVTTFVKFLPDALFFNETGQRLKFQIEMDYTAGFYQAGNTEVLLQYVADNNPGTICNLSTAKIVGGVLLGRDQAGTQPQGCYAPGICCKSCAISAVIKY